MLNPSWSKARVAKRQPGTALGRRARTRLALGLGQAAAAMSRRIGRGSGATIPGLIGLKVAPDLLRTLSSGRRVAVVSATNGKTTTTAMLTAALSTATPVLSNSDGSNLKRGVLAALMTDPDGSFPSCVFEVDELALDTMTDAISPQLLVFGNLSRDQLDRLTEVRALSARWQHMLVGLATRFRAGGTGAGRMVVVANADDPLVAAAVMPLMGSEDGKVEVVWVGAGQLWTADASSCPRCAGPWVTELPYRCADCGFARPLPAWALEGNDLVSPDGSRRSLALSLPGRANRANATLAVAAASQWGVDVDAALEAISSIVQVGGRFATLKVGDAEARLLLAKNPAGWQEMLADGVVVPGEGPPHPVVLVLNAQGPDGRDTSWIWDVPFEQLRGRRVVVSGERAEDLALRLRYAEVDFELRRDPLEAVVYAANDRAGGSSRVDVIANYTAFTSLRARLRSAEQP